MAVPAAVARRGRRDGLVEATPPRPSRKRLPPARVPPILTVKSQDFKPSFRTANEQVVCGGERREGPGGQWEGEELPGSWLTSANNFPRSDGNSVKRTLFHMKETPAFH
jgi:hypothetical protein